MIDKLSKAFAILADNLLLITLIYLTALPITIGMTMGMVEMTPEHIPSSFWYWLLASMLVGVLVQGALFSALSDLESGQKASYSAAMGVALQNYWPLLLATIVVSLIVGFGFILLIVPGVYFALRFALVYPIVLFEKVGVGAALTRSGELMEGKKLEFLGCVVLFAIGFMLLNIALSLFLGVLSLSGAVWAQVLLTTVTQIVASAIQIVVFLYYLDATRKGSLDVDSEGGEPEPTESPVLVDRDSTKLDV